jgi:hypothetical protein
VKIERVRDVGTTARHPTKRDGGGVAKSFTLTLPLQDEGALELGNGAEKR